MKRVNLIVSSLAVAGLLVACNDTGNSTTSADSTGSTMSADSNSATTTDVTNNTPSATTPMMPLSAPDSAFAMKAATGGMMEVESSNVALQNAASDRVKAFATMMVADHSKANQELMSIASGKGVTLPAALPADKQKHIDEMKKMTGKAFDKHYINMMMTDHKKDVSEFEKQASSGNDAELKAFADKTLPTLKMHRDSVMALSKMKM